MPAQLIFKGQGKLSFAMKAKLASKKKSSGVHFSFQEKAWFDTDGLKTWFKEWFLPAKIAALGAETWALLLLDGCGQTHQVDEFKALCHANRVLCWYGEPNMTDTWQPIDASIGLTTRDLALGPGFGLEAWLYKSKKNGRAWKGKKTWR